MMKILLVAASVGEALFGLFVLAAPGLAFALLFGTVPAADAVIMTRVAGIALIGLGIACYPPGSPQGFYGMLTYGVLVTLYLIAVGVGGTAGVLLWPAVVVHALLSASLVVAARKGQSKTAT